MSESLGLQCPRLLDLLQSPIGPESRKEAKERKKEKGVREAARKEIALKNKFRGIQEEDR